MVVLLRFQSARFDPAAEPPNPINPIPGHALLRWAGEVLRGDGFRCDEPRPEDWGWYLDVVDPAGRRFLVGASGENGAGGLVEWCLQLHARRSLGERLRGRGALGPDAPLVRSLETRLRAEPDIAAVEREAER